MKNIELNQVGFAFTDDTNINEPLGAGKEVSGMPKLDEPQTTSTPMSMEDMYLLLLALLQDVKQALRESDRQIATAKYDAGVKAADAQMKADLTSARMSMLGSCFSLGVQGKKVRGDLKGGRSENMMNKGNDNNTVLGSQNANAIGEGGQNLGKSWGEMAAADDSLESKNHDASKQMLETIQKKDIDVTAVYQSLQNLYNALSKFESTSFR
ncbi:hypothetical protein ACNO7T_22915 [Vibrio campbellii]